MRRRDDQIHQKKKDLESYSFSDGAVETVIVFVYETCNSLCTSFLWLDGSSFFCCLKGGGVKDINKLLKKKRRRKRNKCVVRGQEPDWDR